LTVELKTNGFRIKEIFADAAGKPFHRGAAEMAIVAVPDE